MAVIPEHHDENGGGGEPAKPVSAEPGGRRGVLIRRIAISAGAAAGYGVLLLVALSGVPDLPTALGPRPVPRPQATSQPPATTPPTTPPPTTTTDGPTPSGPRTASPPESWGAPEPVLETMPTSARPAPVRTTTVSGPPDARAPSTTSPADSERRNSRAPDDPPGHARTTPPKSGR
ncbi:hypothetical protein [Amycolatopsis sp. WAC 01376]|uniref:hypothetical protein n=1 Tax=Amycolatopsis sp. WAC 01376 TaxID=2203195 RepID=UPI000F78CA37|nr:hypothetical protein [Amycolatopsis sp. WAC 01376]